MKTKYITLIALFLIPITVIGTFCIFDKDAVISVRENRALKTLPELSVESLFFGDFTLNFESYFTDTFPFRDAIMGANTELNRLYYFSPKAKKDNLSLMIDQTNDIADGGEALHPAASVIPSPAPSVTPSDAPSEETAPTSPSAEPTPSPIPEPALDNPSEADLQTGSIIIVGNRAMEITNAKPTAMTGYANALNLYQEKMPNSRIISLIAPNGGEFYSPEEFHTGVHSQKDMIDSTYLQMNDLVVPVDAYSVLRQHIDEYLYFRTDHHWTQLGAYYAYTAFCETLGMEAYTLDQFEPGTIENFVGSMFTFTSKYPQSAVLKENPDTLYFYRPTRSFSAKIYTDGSMDESTAQAGYVISGKVTQSNKYLAFINGDTPLFHIKTDVGNGKRIIVIKESYGNAFTPFLINHYEEIYVIDPRKYAKNAPSFDLTTFVAEHNIDDVLVIDYPMVISSDRYVEILKNIIK